jgi:hypothetical protein
VAFRWLIVLGIAASVAWQLGQRAGQPESRSAEDEGACQASRDGLAQFKREHPEVDTTELEAATERNCREGFPRAPVGTPAALPSSPGCGEQPDGGTRRAGPARRSAPPARRIPFFSARAGALPATGRPEVAGARLPEGVRCGFYWASGEPMRDPDALADRLADAFPRTGLWPLIWVDDGPGGYLNGPGALARSRSLSASEVFRRVWRESRAGEFPGLARGSRARGGGEVATAPFAARRRFSKVRYGPQGTLLLVAVNRPSEAIVALGASNTEVLGDEDMSAVLRSWEERFGAIPTVLGPGYLELVVDRPPRLAADVRHLAVEHQAFAPDDEEIGETFTPEDRVWPFAWVD